MGCCETIRLLRQSYIIPSVAAFMRTHTGRSRGLAMRRKSRLPSYRTYSEQASRLRYREQYIIPKFDTDGESPAVPEPASSSAAAEDTSTDMDVCDVEQVG